MKKLVVIVVMCLLIGVTLVYAGQNPPTVYIEVNQLMTNDTLQWYDVYAVENDTFVGFFTISYTGIHNGWELSQLTPHGNTSHFTDNIDYITSFSDNLITALNGDNKVYLPIITR